MAQTNAQRTKSRPTAAKRTRSSSQGGRAGSANGASGGTRARSSRPVQWRSELRRGHTLALA